MWIRFNNDCQVAFDPVAPFDAILGRMYKHLQYVPLPWREWDNGNFRKDPIVFLIQAGQKIGVNVDAARCDQQSYLNWLHQTYENLYDGKPEWLDYHELIHVCEKSLGYSNTLVLDHRELAGPLSRPFDPEWMCWATTQVPPGSIFIQWAELGKKPYSYWKDGEPQDLGRLCALAKPWLTLRGSINVALDQIDFMENKDHVRFESWWQHFEKPWCDHWQIKSWSLRDQYSVIPIGDLDPYGLAKVRQWISEGYHPTHVGL